MEGKNDTSFKYKIIRFFGLKILDIYIIRKFLSTFLLSIALILSIVVIFDLSEKIDDFLESGAKLNVSCLIITSTLFHTSLYFSVRCLHFLQ